MKKTKTQSYATVPVTVVQVIVTSCISVQLLYTDCNLCVGFKKSNKKDNTVFYSVLLLVVHKACKSLGSVQIL